MINELQKTHTWLFCNLEIESFDTIKCSSKTNKISFEKEIVPTFGKLKKGELILIVVINQKRHPFKNIDDSNEWEERTLGSWIISESKQEKIKYLIGIDLTGRSLATIIKVKGIDKNGKKAKFKKEDILYNHKDEKKQEGPYNYRLGTMLMGAVLWNPQNPIKYFNIVESDFIYKRPTLMIIIELNLYLVA